VLLNNNNIINKKIKINNNNIAVNCGNSKDIQFHCHAVISLG